MTVWIPKEDFPHWEERLTKQATWKGNILAYQTFLRQSKVIHFENLYRYMFRYITDEGWKNEDGTRMLEHFYGEARNTDGEKQVRIWWRAQKDPGGIFPKHTYLRYRLYVDFLTEHMKRIEMTHGGKKIRPYLGDVHIWIAAVLEIDFQNWAKKDAIFKLFNEYFVRRIYKRNIRDQEVELRRFAARFVDDVKHFISMTRPSDVRVPLDSEERQFY